MIVFFFNLALSSCNTVCVCVCVSHLIVSDSLRPLELELTRLLCPWNSPGKSTGVGSHSLLPGGLPDLGFEPKSQVLQVGSLPSEPPGKPSSYYNWLQNPAFFNQKKGTSSSMLVEEMGKLIQVCPCIPPKRHLI